MRADASGKQPGQYEALYVPRQPGAYSCGNQRGRDGRLASGRHACGDGPATLRAEEFRRLQPDATLAGSCLARTTGGEMVDPADLDDFAEKLPKKQAQIMEPYEQPFWHQSWVFLLAIGLLGAEWRSPWRARGLP